MSTSALRRYEGELTLLYLQRLVELVTPCQRDQQFGQASI